MKNIDMSTESINKIIVQTLKIVKPKIVHITLMGMILIFIEMMFHLFGEETKSYIIFSSNIHWMIIFLLISIHFLNVESKPSQAIQKVSDKHEQESFEPYFPTFISILLYLILLYFYIFLDRPNGEILFEEGERVLIVGRDTVLRVIALDSFYMYKHYHSIVGLLFLLLFYIDILLPASFFVRRDYE